MKAINQKKTFIIYYNWYFFVFKTKVNYFCRNFANFTINFMSFLQSYKAKHVKIKIRSTEVIRCFKKFTTKPTLPRLVYSLLPPPFKFFCHRAGERLINVNSTCFTTATTQTRINLNYMAPLLSKSLPRGPSKLKN